jgi:hypothetical protein
MRDRLNNIDKVAERKKVIFAASQPRIIELFPTMRLTVENRLCYKRPDCY